MLIDKLVEVFGYDTPIFTSEILKVFPQFTRAYIFRLMKMAQDNCELVKIDTGSYYVPSAEKAEELRQKRSIAEAPVSAEDVALKRYIESDGEVFGIYSGRLLQQQFQVEMQNKTDAVEIITNNEATRRRKVTIDGTDFVLRKSRVDINKENVAAYRLLELFTETSNIQLTDASKKIIAAYIKSEKITRADLIDLSHVFPAKTLKSMIYCDVV